MSKINKKVVRNSELFDEYLKSRGMSYKDVYAHLNGYGITKYNDILNASGVLTEVEVDDYLGNRDYHSADNGARTPAQKRLDCEVGNIQETLFCIDNIQFETNDGATNKDVKVDSEITTKKLDLIHTPTNREVEFKTSYCREVDSVYDTAIYRHRDGNFEKYINSGKIVIIYFPYLKKVAVIAKRNYGRSVNCISSKVDENGKLWDVISVWKGLFYDYDMMKFGNNKISEKVSNLVKYK